jgi:hypothetical protein
MAELFENKGHNGTQKQFGISFVTMIVIKILKMKISNLNPKPQNVWYFSIIQFIF